VSEDLASSTLDWYGTAFQVRRLDDATAGRIRSTIFI
jgi:hypothetical protein